MKCTPPCAVVGGALHTNGCSPSAPPWRCALRTRFSDDYDPARRSLRTAVVEHKSSVSPIEVSPAASAVGTEVPLKEACELFEREYVIRVLRRLRWNISGAARVLGVHRNTILKKLTAWGLHRPSVDGDRTES
jgi:DNA-binding NtrC family response regulator